MSFGLEAGDCVEPPTEEISAFSTSPAAIDFDRFKLTFWSVGGGPQRLECGGLMSSRAAGAWRDR